MFKKCKAENRDGYCMVMNDIFKCNDNQKKYCIFYSGDPSFKPNRVDGYRLNEE